MSTSLSPTPSPRRTHRTRPPPAWLSLGDSMSRESGSSACNDNGRGPCRSSSPDQTPRLLASPIQRLPFQQQPYQNTSQQPQQQQHARQPYPGSARSVHAQELVNHSVDLAGFSDITDSLRPVHEYHNGFANEDDDAATAHSTPSSPFPSFSAASRAFLSHHRQQSIPNLLPSVAASIGRTIGRAISPERALLFRPAQPACSPIPAFRPHHAERHSDDSDDSDDDIMAYTGDARTKRGETTYTTYTTRRTQARTSVGPGNGTGNGSSNAASSTDGNAGAGFSSWLARGSKPTSPSRPASRGATPEPSSATLTVWRTGSTAGNRRRTSVVSESAATPRSTAPTPSALTPASGSRFAQMALTMSNTLSRLTQQSPASPRTTAAASSSLEDDEFFNLDIGAALFPAGHPSERDAFSPAAFKNLETNAVGTLSRVREAYRQRAVAMNDLAAEMSVRDEELEEAETRVQHLKMQLEGMGQKAAQQDLEMKALADELMAERKARAQERAAMMAGVPMTPTGSSDVRDDDQATISVSEDLGVDEAERHQQRQWRKSNKSDGSYDTDECDVESAADDGSSVFSRSRSPTIAPSVAFGSESAEAPSAAMPHVPHVSHPRVAALGSGVRLSKPAAAQPLNAFQKIVKNVTGANKDDDLESEEPGECRNCRGKDVSFAWNTVSILRDENQHLKQRVGLLEVAVEGALDAVQGIGL